MQIGDLVSVKCGTVNPVIARQLRGFVGRIVGTDDPKSDFDFVVKFSGKVTRPGGLYAFYEHQLELVPEELKDRKVLVSLR